MVRAGEPRQWPDGEGASQMKAVLCRRHGGPEVLDIEELPEPRPCAGEVVVRVRAARVAFTDVLLVSGDYQVRPPFPFSPGGEVAGIVSSLGEGVRGLAVGDRVAAFINNGGFRESVAVSAERCQKLPDSLDFVTGCSFLLTYGTSLFGLADRGRLQAGERLLVLGAASGVGLAAVELGKILGATVVAAAGSPERAEFARSHGADHVHAYPRDLSGVGMRKQLTSQWLELSGGTGFDVVFDPLGGHLSESAMRALAWEGRHVVVGFASSLEIPRIALNLPLMRNASVVGALWGPARQRQPERAQEITNLLLAWWHEGRIRPEVTRTLPLERAADALRALNNREVLGRMVLTVD